MDDAGNSPGWDTGLDFSRALNSLEQAKITLVTEVILCAICLPSFLLPGWARG